MIEVGSARIDENGNANWGKAGDQNACHRTILLTPIRLDYAST